MFGLGAEEWRDLLLSVNVHRSKRRCSPQEVANLLARALEHVDAEELARELGFSDTSTLRRILRLNELPEELAGLVDWGARRGSLSMSAASELMRLQQEQQQRLAFISAAQHSLTKEEARQLVQLTDRSSVSISDAVESVLATRPKIERTELILGSLLTERAKSVRAQLGADESARRIMRAIARRYPSVVCRTARVATGSFSLSFRNEEAQKLRELLGDTTIEEAISRILEEQAT